jgi:hypothetical protein
MMNPSPSTPTIASALGARTSDRKLLDLDHTRQFVHGIFHEQVHAKRVLSLANGVAGVLQAAVLSVHAIGQAYAALAEITPKSAVKQIDRMLSNSALSLDVTLEQWARFVVGDHPSIVVALDWTDFEADDHTTLCAFMVTTHGRAMPLCWKTVKKSELKDRRTALELEMIERLHGDLPEEVCVTLLADRGFGYQELYELLAGLGWDYVIRFRGSILVEARDGSVLPAQDWVPPNGRTRMLVGARVTVKRAEVGAVVTVKAKGMKEPWCLATSLAEAKAADIVKLYGRRFTIEEGFRDTKDLHFGMGLSATHIGDANRRDRLLLLVAMAQALLTLLGAASEESGLDRYLKVNTVKRRTHSLYRQGLYWFSALPTMREDWLRRLIEAFDRLVRENRFFSFVFGLK